MSFEDCISWKLAMPSARYTKHYYSEMHADRKSNPLHKLRRIALVQTLPKRSIGKFFPFVLRYEWHSGKRWKFRDSNPGLSGYEPDVLTNWTKFPEQHIVGCQQQCAAIAILNHQSQQRLSISTSCYDPRKPSGTFEVPLISSVELDGNEVKKRKHKCQKSWQAGLVGFEPTHDGIKARYLTFWW